MIVTFVTVAFFVQFFQSGEIKMNNTAEKINEINLKREEAITTVKYNLKRYASLKTDPLLFEDRVASFSSYIINVSNDTNNNDYNKILKALVNEEKDREFVLKYDSLLSCLCPESNEYLIRVYFKHEKIQAIKEENMNIWYFLKDTYEILACLDEDIDYNIDDYTMLRDYKAKYKNNSTWAVKTQAMDFLKKFNNGYMKKEIQEILNKIPEREKNQMMNYINCSDNLTFSSYEYRMVLRGLLIFAYYFERIDFNIIQLEEALKRTGSGWQKIMRQIE